MREASDASCAGRYTTWVSEMRCTATRKEAPRQLGWKCAVVEVAKRMRTTRRLLGSVFEGETAARNKCSLRDKHPSGRL